MPRVDGMISTPRKLSAKDDGAWRWIGYWVSGPLCDKRVAKGLISSLPLQTKETCRSYMSKMKKCLRLQEPLLGSSYTFGQVGSHLHKSKLQDLGLRTDGMRTNVHPLAGEGLKNMTILKPRAVEIIPILWRNTSRARPLLKAVISDRHVDIQYTIYVLTDTNLHHLLQ